jgi:hypothetical protein
VIDLLDEGGKVIIEEARENRAGHVVTRRLVSVMEYWIDFSVVNLVKKAGTQPWVCLGGECWSLVAALHRVESVGPSVTAAECAVFGDEGVLIGL